jgi:hypothetical protein
MLSVCLCIPPIIFWMAEPVFMKLDIYILVYIMAPKPILTVYFVNPSVFVFMCVYPYRC